MTDKYAVIEAESANYKIVDMCNWLNVSRSGFYDWRARETSATEQHHETITALVIKVFNEFKQRYGYRKIRAELRRRGTTVSEWLIRKIMQEQALVACQPRPWRATTDNDGTVGPVDLLNGDFTAVCPGDYFVGDITYIRTWAGWTYLATVIDLFNREVVGYAIATHMRTTLITDALGMAIDRGRVNPNAVFHSDRGSQYTSHEFHQFLTNHNLRGSMGRTGVCWDNAVAESFFATLKKELIHREVYPTFNAVKSSVRKYIEVFYNRRRIHSKLGYNTPIETRQAWETSQLAA